jgi:hypothetical protein
MITDDMIADVDEENLRSNGTDKASPAALWMLLLLRLTSITADERVELRNSAFSLRDVHAQAC